MPPEAELTAAVADTVRWPARLDLQVEGRAGEAVLTTRRHEGPLRVQKALYPEGRDLAHLVIVHPPGGIAGGDQLRINVAVGSGAAALLTTPGATKWYKANGALATQQVHLQVADGAVLEWLPQENIVFDGAHAAMHLDVACTGAGRACGWEVTVLGRQAAGERFAAGLLRQQIAVRRDGALLWAERGRVAGDDALLASPLGWAGQHVSGLFWALGAPFSEALLEAMRATAAVDVRLGITLFPHGLLVARVLGTSPEQVRSVLTSLWLLIRPVLCGRPGVPPRIWAT